MKGQPTKFVQGHNGRRTAHDFLIDAAGCWVWLRSRSAGGYGQVVRRGRTLQAHRHYYERLVGPITPGHDLDHLCRNRACVNPAHLEPVTRAVNARRGRNTKLSPDDVAVIRKLLGAGMTHGAIAGRFGVRRQTIGDIATGRRWAAQ